MMARGRPKKNSDDATVATSAKANGNGANIGFEAQMFLAADKLPSCCHAMRNRI